MAKPLPNQEVLQGLLSYNSSTGILSWRFRDERYFQTARSFKMWNTRYANKAAFRKKVRGGYLCGRLFGQEYTAARIIWVLVYGYEPEQIDHINGNPGDNRLENLRSVSPKENCRNRSRISSNTSGETGIRWRERERVWYAYIKADGRQKTVGFFKTKAEAVAARKSAAAALGFHENHGRATHG